MPGIPTWRRQMFLDRLIWMADGPAQDPPGRRKLLSAEVMCERVDETGCASTMSNNGIFLLTVDPLNLNASF